MALLMTASLTACGSTANVTYPEPVTITLEDAGEVLNVLEALPPVFSRIDPDLSRYTREYLELPPDASVVESFQADGPFQLILCFLRVVDDEMRRQRLGVMLFDEADTRNIMSVYLQMMASEISDSKIGDEVSISYPDVAAGASLVDGEIGIGEFKLQVRLLRFRSRDTGVFVYVMSFHEDEGHESVVNVAVEIERRIVDFGSQ